MDEWTEIRRKVLVEGASKRSIHRDYGIGHQALAKILANAEPPGYQMAEIRRKPVLGPYLAIIDEILADDKEAPPKQRHTARRIFERLRTSTATPAVTPRCRRGEVGQGATRRRCSSRSSIHRATPSSTSARRPSRSPASARKAALGGDDAALLGHVLPLRLSARVHRDLPGRPTWRAFEFFGGVPAADLL